MSDGSKGTPRITVGVDLGDRYSYLCFHRLWVSGEVYNPLYYNAHRHQSKEAA